MFIHKLQEKPMNLEQLHRSYFAHKICLCYLGGLSLIEKKMMITVRSRNLLRLYHYVKMLYLNIVMLLKTFSKFSTRSGELIMTSFFNAGN